MHIGRTFFNISVLCFTVNMATVYAQGSEFPDFHFETLTTEDGLNFRDVVAIDQDEDGMMWFGTTQGLIRYDGYQFKLYDSDLQNPFYIPEEAIGVEGIASKGDHELWFLGHSKLFLLNTLTDEIRTFGPTEGINGDVAKLLLDDDKQLWIVTDNYYSDSGNDKDAQQYLLKQVSPDSFAVVHAVPRRLSGLTHLTLSPDNKIWWSTLSRGQTIVSQDGRSITSLQLDSVSLPQGKTYPGFPHFRSNGTLYYTTGKNEIKRFEQGRLSPIVHQTDRFVSTSLEDHRGNLWLGSLHSIYLITPEDELLDITPFIRENLAFGEPHQFFLDRQSILWIATDFGLVKVRLAEHFFDQFLNGDENTLSNTVRGFAETKDGTILVMNEFEKRLYQLSPDNIVSPYVMSTSQGQQNASAFNAARFFVSDREQRYAYTANEFLVQIDMDLNSYFVDTSISPYPDVFNLNPIAILRDGKLVMGHTLRTLSVYNPSTRTYVSLLSADEHVPNVENVRFILQSRQPNIVWVGTHENGVYKLEVGGGILDHFSIDSQPALTKNAVLVLYEDIDTSLWIGTFGGGINHYHPRTEVIQYYDINNSFPDNNIVGILPESDSIIWFSTYNGLCRFNKRTGSVRNFYKEDGLTHNEFNYASFHKDRRGRFYFGGMNGFVRFLPNAKQLTKSSFPAPQLTLLSRYDRRAKEAHTIDLIQNPMDKLSISPYDAYFQLHWSIPSYFSNSENRYYVKLEGLDDDWVFNENRPTVRFNRLDPGSYVLRVKAVDFRGNTALSELALPIYVQPIFYKTWWFVVLSILALSGVIYFIFQYRLQRLLEMEKLRTKISSDLHDDLGSMLSGLAMQSEILEMNAREEDKMRLQTITSTSRKAVHRMRDLVWSIDARKDTVSDLIDKMHETAEDLLPSAGFSYTLNTDHFVNGDKKLSVNVRQNLFLIFKEAINNILKHSNGDHVEITLTKDTRYVALRIWDNGTGSASGTNGSSTLTTTGQGLMNMQMRVQHLKGTFHCHNREGFEIVVTVPANHIFM